MTLLRGEKFLLSVFFQGQNFTNGAEKVTLQQFQKHNFDIEI